MENRHDCQCGTSARDPPWINTTNNTVIARMNADDPTPDERLEPLRSPEHAREIIGLKSLADARHASGLALKVHLPATKAKHHAGF